MAQLYTKRVQRQCDQRALAKKLFEQAFSTARDPRSDEYKAGVKAALMYRAAGVPIKRPYEIGTAEADAFYAGQDEGMLIWREYTAGKKTE